VKKKIKKINQIKNFKKKSLLQSTIIYEEMHNKNYYIEMVTQLSVLLILSLFDYKITKNLYFCMIINQTYIYIYAHLFNNLEILDNINKLKGNAKQPRYGCC